MYSLIMEYMHMVNVFVLRILGIHSPCQLVPYIKEIKTIKRTKLKACMWSSSVQQKNLTVSVSDVNKFEAAYCCLKGRKA